MKQTEQIKAKIDIEAMVEKRKFRKLLAKIWLTSEIIKKIEQYHKEHYEN